MSDLSRLLKGFSMIELLTVVAIVSILSAIAVPIYKSYNFHAKLARAVPLINSVSDQLVTAYQTGNTAPTIRIGTSDVTVTRSAVTTSGPGGSIFPLVEPFPVEAINTTLFNRGWVVIQGAYPLHGFAISSTRKTFDGKSSVIIVNDYQIKGLEGLTGYIAPSATVPYAPNGHGILRNLIVIDEETGLISKYCGNVNGGANQYDIVQEYLDKIDCTCRTISTAATGVAGLGCQ